MVGRWWGFSFAEALDFPTFSDPPEFPQDLFSRFHHMEWQPLWSWFLRKMTSSLNVIFRGRLFVPSTSDPANPVSPLLWHHHEPPSSGRHQLSASPWNYGTFGTFRPFSLGCITRRKCIKKASCRNGTRLLVLLCFLGCQTLIRFVIFRLIVSVTRQLFRLFVLDWWYCILCP